MKHHFGGALLEGPPVVSTGGTPKASTPYSYSADIVIIIGSPAFSFGIETTSLHPPGDKKKIPTPSIILRNGTRKTFTMFPKRFLGFRRIPPICRLGLKDNYKCPNCSYILVEKGRTRIALSGLQIPLCKMFFQPIRGLSPVGCFGAADGVLVAEEANFMEGLSDWHGLEPVHFDEVFGFLGVFGIGAVVVGLCQHIEGGEGTVAGFESEVVGLHGR